MTRNGRQRPARPRIELASAPDASPEEAAAIAAAIERFLRDTAPAPAAPAEERLSPWARAALLEGTASHPADQGRWADPEPWGSGRS